MKEGKKERRKDEYFQLDCLIVTICLIEQDKKERKRERERERERERDEREDGETWGMMGDVRKGGGGQG